MFWGRRRENQEATNGNNGAGVTSHDVGHPLVSEAALLAERKLVQGYFLKFIEANSKLKKIQILYTAIQDSQISQIFKQAGDDVETKKKLLLVEFLRCFLYSQQEIQKDPNEYLIYFLNFFNFLSSDHYRTTLLNLNTLPLLEKILSYFQDASLFSHVSKGSKYVRTLAEIQKMLASIQPK